MSGVRFKVLLSVRPSVPIDFLEAERLSVSVDSTDFLLERVRPDGSLLRLTASTEDESVDGALKKTYTWGQAIVSFIEFLTQVGFTVSADRAWEVTKSKRRGPFLQFIHDVPMKPGFSRVLSFGLFNRLQEAYSGKPMEDQLRLARAIRWFRAGLEGSSSIDQYLGLWIGLEVLDYFRKGPVEFESCVPKEKLKERCLKTEFYCKGGHEQRPREQLNRGIRRMLDTNFGRMRNLRNAIVHGGAALQDILDECTKYLPIAGGTLFKQIGELMSLPDSHRLPSLFLRGNYQTVRIDGTLEAKDVNTDLSTEHLYPPFFDVDPEKTHLGLSDGRLGLEPPFVAKVDMRFSLIPSGVYLVDGISRMSELHQQLLMKELQGRQHSGSIEEKGEGSPRWNHPIGT